MDSKRDGEATHTRATVLDGAVRARELGEVVASHFGLDLNRVEDLAVVDGNDGADELGNNYIRSVLTTLPLAMTKPSY